MFAKLSGLRLGVAGLVLLMVTGASAAEGKKPSSCIWKVTGEKATVYLAGSIHLLREEDHPLPADYDTAYADSKKVYFEIHPAEMNAPETQVKMMQLSMLPEGKSIKDLVSKETYAKLTAYLDKRGLGVMSKAFLRFKPGMLSITITSLEMMQLGIMPQYGVETGFFESAVKDGKEVVGLETVEFQLGMFDQLKPELQEEFLNMTLDQVKETPAMMKDLIESWKTGDAEKLNELIHKDFKENDELLKVMLLDRNASWVPAVEKEMGSTAGNTMFIVGAGHLIGPGSVVDLLQKKGYKVERFVP